MRINPTHVFWFLLILCILAFTYRVYAEITEDRPTDENIGICGNHCWVDLRGKNLKEWKEEDHIRKVEVSTPIKEKQSVRKVEKEIRKELPKENRPFDPVKFSKAVAKQETASGTKWYWKEYNNLVGMKNGRIAPCKKIGRNRMCIYDTPEESLVAFRKVWEVGYGNKFPTLRMAQVYSWNDRAWIWLANVTKFYNEQF